MHNDPYGHCAAQLNTLGALVRATDRGCNVRAYGSKAVQVRLLSAPLILVSSTHIGGRYERSRKRLGAFESAAVSVEDDC
jgi:hypothetical protein